MNSNLLNSFDSLFKKKNKQKSKITQKFTPQCSIYNSKLKVNAKIPGMKASKIKFVKFWKLNFKVSTKLKPALPSPVLSHYKSTSSDVHFSRVKFTHQICCLPKAFYCNLRMDTFLYKRLHLLEELAGKQSDCCCSITNLHEYCTRNVQLLT